MDRRYKHYEIPPMWNFAPVEEVDIILENILRQGHFIGLLGSKTYRFKPTTGLTPTMDVSMISSAKFYHCELVTNELEIFTGPRYPYEDPDTKEVGIEYHHVYGRIKPGKKLYISPGFLARYCIPSDSFEYEPGEWDKVKSKLYPEHNDDIDLTHITKIVDTTAKTHYPIYVVLNGIPYGLEYLLHPIYPPDQGNVTLNLICQRTVKPQDSIAIFYRRDFPYRQHEDDDEYIICLLGELRDLA